MYIFSINIRAQVNIAGRKQTHFYCQKDIHARNPQSYTHDWENTLRAEQSSTDIPRFMAKYCIYINLKFHGPDHASDAYIEGSAPKISHNRMFGVYDYINLIFFVKIHNKLSRHIVDQLEVVLYHI